MEREASYWSRKSGTWNRRRVLGAGGALAGGLAAAAFAGCGDDDSKTPSATAAPTKSGGQTPGASPSAAASASASAAATPVDLSKLAEKDFYAALPLNPPRDWQDKDVKTGGKLTRLFNSNPSLDLVTATLTAPPQEVTLPVYNRLIRMKAGDDSKNPAAAELEPDLATAWERPDPLTLTFTLSPGIKFQNAPPLNGRAMTVDDIKYMVDHGQNYAKSAYKSQFNEIASVTDLGGGKVQFKLSGPDPAADLLIASFFMSIIPKEIADAPDVATRLPVGTGGFICKSITPNVSYEYEKNPDYFKKDATGRQKPYVDKYTLQVVADAATRAAIFEKGDAEFAYGSGQAVTTDTVYQFIKRNPAFSAATQRTGSLAGPWRLLGHHATAPWSDVRVRRALNMLVDRKGTNDSLYRGLATFQPYFPWPSVFDTAQTIDQMGPNYKYDPATAKQLLSAAGFPNGLEMDLHWYSVLQTEDWIVTYQQTAAAGGVKFNLIKAPDNVTNFNKLTSKSWTGIILNPTGIDYPDPMATLPVYLPNTARNQGDLNDPDFVTLYEKQRGLLGNDRKVVLKQIWDRMLDQIYDVVLPSGFGIEVWNPRLKNWHSTWWGASSGAGLGQVDSMWIKA